MRFGDFLVQQGAVTPVDVLTALAEQQRLRPFLPLAMVKSGCLNAEQALRLCDLSEDRGCDFLEVIQKEGLLTMEQAIQIQSKLRKLVPPIGILMVQLGIISDETRVAMMGEFCKLH